MSLVSSVMSCRTVSSRCRISPVSRSHYLSDLLQVLSILTMERPVSFSAEDIRDEKVSADQAKFI